MTHPSRQFRYQRGFSLGEMLVALVIGAMVLTAILTIYARANRAATAILSKIDTSTLADEVLQLIAEDLDTTISGGSDVVVTVENKLDGGLAKARLVLRRTYFDAKNEEKTFEQITYQAAPDYESASPVLVLYRSHEGINLEDKLLDEQRKNVESSYPFVPVCTGVTFFKVEAFRADTALVSWVSPLPPQAIKVTISFADPFKTVTGTLEVPEEQKISRMIAVDRTRKIAFQMPAPAAEQQKTNVQTPPKP